MPHVPDSSKRELCLSLRLEGMSYGQIGQILGVSRQRAQQLISPPAAIRARVVEIANGCCQGCGVVDEHAHIHHLKAKDCKPEDYQDVKNLRLLCLACHREAHGKRRFRPPSARLVSFRKDRKPGDKPWWMEEYEARTGIKIPWPPPHIRRAKLA